MDRQARQPAGREREEHHKRPRKRVPACVASNRIKVLFSIRHLRPRLPELLQDPPPGKGGERNLTSGALVVRTDMSFRQSGDENAEDIPKLVGAFTSASGTPSSRKSRPLVRSIVPSFLH